MPLKTFTQQEFLQVRPQGDYQKYLKHIRRARKNRNQPRAAPRAAATPFDPLAPLTPQQMNQQATQWATTQLQPLQREQTRLGQVRAENIAGYSAALAKMLGEIAPRTAAAYQAAGTTTEAFGAGFRDAIGAMQGNADNPYANQAAGVLSSLAGLGAGALGRLGAAETYKLGQEPLYAAGIGAQALRTSDAETAEAIKALQDKYPGMRLEFLQQLRQNELNKEAARLARQQLNLSKRGQKLAESQFLEGVRQFNASNELQWATLRQNQSQFEASIVEKGKDRWLQAMLDGNDTKANAIDVKNQAIYDMVPDMGKAASSLHDATKLDVMIATEPIFIPNENKGSKMIDQNGNEIFDIRDEVQAKDENGNPKFKTVRHVENIPAPVGFREAYDRMYALYGTILRDRWRVGEKRIRDLIMSALASAGYQEAINVQGF